MTKLIFKYFLILLIFFNFIFQANSEIKKKGIEDKNKFGSLYPSVTKIAFDKIDDDVKPLFEHWLE